MNTQVEISAPDTGQLIEFDLRALARFSTEGPSVTVLADTGAARSVLFAFRAGQQLKERRTSSQILVQVLRGRVTFTAAGQSTEVKAGTLLHVEADVPHSITARTNAAVLVVMTPSPSYHSLEAEVFQCHTPLVTRVEAHT